MAEKNANTQTHRHTDTQTHRHFRIYISRDTTGCETHLKFLELSVFNLNKIYLATIKLKSNREIG